MKGQQAFGEVTHALMRKHNSLVIISACSAEFDRVGGKCSAELRHRAHRHRAQTNIEFVISSNNSSTRPNFVSEMD